MDMFAPIRQDNMLAHSQAQTSEGDKWRHNLVAEHLKQVQAQGLTWHRIPVDERRDYQNAFDRLVSYVRSTEEERNRQIYEQYMGIGSYLKLMELIEKVKFQRSVLDTIGPQYVFTMEEVHQLTDYFQNVLTTVTQYEEESLRAQTS